MPNPTPADDAPFDPDKYLMEQYLAEKTGAARPFDPDAYLLEKYLAEKTAPPGALDAFGRGATRGIGDRILARAQALGAQNAPLPQNLPERSMAEQLVNPTPPSRPVDEARFEADRARILNERRVAGARAEGAHGAAYTAGGLVPAVASLAIPGASGVKGAAAVGGALGVLGSESDDPARVAAEGALGAGLGGAGAQLLRLLGRGVGRVGEAILPRAEAIRDALASKIADRSAAALEATARSAQGTAGATRANASRALERLGMETGLPAAEVAANQAAAATPEASQLAQGLAARARGELPEKLAQMQAAEALAQQTAADAAGARSPEAVAAMERQMRGEVLKRLLTRYALPAAGGYVAGELTGGHGGYGALAGFGMRPMLRATLRGMTSPGLMAPLSRGLVSGAEGLAGLGAVEGGRAATLLEPGIQPRLAALLDALGRKPALAQNDSDKALDAQLK